MPVNALDLPIETDPDADLMTRFANGDETAFDHLVDRCQAGLVQFFAVNAQDDALAEDLAQETFLRLYRARDAYRRRARFKTYLYRIALNVWRGHLRRKRARVREQSWDAPGGNRSPETTAGPATATPAPFERVRLYRAFQQLSEPHRAVLSLSLIEEMTTSETAAALGIPAGTVKSRLHHAARRLRRLLGERGRKDRP